MQIEEHFARLIQRACPKSYGQVGPARLPMHSLRICALHAAVGALHMRLPQELRAGGAPPVLQVDWLSAMMHACAAL